MYIKTAHLHCIHTIIRSRWWPSSSHGWLEAGMNIHGCRDSICHHDNHTYQQNVGWLSVHNINNSNNHNERTTSMMMTTINSNNHKQATKRATITTATAISKLLLWPPTMIELNPFVNMENIYYGYRTTHGHTWVLLRIEEAETNYWLAGITLISLSL